MDHHLHRLPHGLTLIEVLVVIVLVAAVAGVAVPLLGGAADDAGAHTTQATMQTVRDAILGTADAPGYWDDFSPLPETNPHRLPTPMNRLWIAPAPADLPAGFAFLADRDVQTSLGWNGPYMGPATGSYSVDVATGFTTAYADDGDPALLDGWGRPLVLQVPDVANARLVSAGPDGVLDTPPADTDPSDAAIGDDLVLFVRRSTDNTRNFIDPSGNPVE